MIFVLIAGTYTPVCMVILPGIWGKALLAAVWGIAIFGIFMKIFWMNAPRWLSTLIYVGMGWLAVAAFIPLKRAIGWGGLGMLLAGGIVYTIGAVIYALKKPNLAIIAITSISIPVFVMMAVFPVPTPWLIIKVISFGMASSAPTSKSIKMGAKIASLL